MEKEMGLVAFHNLMVLIISVCALIMKSKDMVKRKHPIEVSIEDFTLIVKPKAMES